MQIERRSLVSGLIRTLEIPVTEEQIEAWEKGAKIQDCMPNLTPSQREFLMSGITDDEWDEAFAEEEDLSDDDEAAF